MDKKRKLFKVYKVEVEDYSGAQPQAVSPRSLLEVQTERGGSFSRRRSIHHHTERVRHDRPSLMDHLARPDGLGSVPAHNYSHTTLVVVSAQD